MTAPTETHHEPFIVTLGFDTATFERLNALRIAHFPRHRNHIPAHATLFHALPGDEEERVREALLEACAAFGTLDLRFPALRFLGRGVAVELDCPELPALRNRLARSLSDALTPQDRQGHRPHVTIQNKVAPHEAKSLFEKLGASWQPFEGRGESLLLWRYKGGPWEAAGEFRLGD